MTPAFTLTLSADALHAASAIIGQQMRLADVVIDQSFAVQRALWSGDGVAAVKPAQAKANKTAAPAKPAKVAVQKAPVFARAQAKATPAAKPKTAQKSPAPKLTVVDTPAAKPAVKAKAKPVASVAAKTVPAAKTPSAKKAAPAGKSKKVTVPDIPWDGKKAPAKK